MKVWKYEAPLTPSDVRFTLDMPHGARLLALQMQRDTPQLWALVSPDAPMEPRQFVWAGTGHEITGEYWNDLNYVGSVQMADGAFVFHLFESMAGQP